MDEIQRMYVEDLGQTISDNWAKMLEVHKSVDKAEDIRKTAEFYSEFKKRQETRAKLTMEIPETPKRTSDPLSFDKEALLKNVDKEKLAKIQAQLKSQTMPEEKEALASAIKEGLATRKTLKDKIAGLFKQNDREEK